MTITSNNIGSYLHHIEKVYIKTEEDKKDRSLVKPIWIPGHERGDGEGTPVVTIVK